MHACERVVWVLKRLYLDFRQLETILLPQVLRLIEVRLYLHQILNSSFILGSLFLIS
jgi:hypothetical protein